ncbi:MAG TPA: DUF411 domain-containing protein [Wenzhouxiangella sp.]|nr:DUF411 domain-containing protein [Wenzhouxiangella sp.]
MMTVTLATVLSLAHGSETAITMYQDPYCGCCSGWADHMREFGFDVKVIKTDGMVSVKRAFGVPAELGSCHTAVVDSTGQIVEGHVPASAVEKMLENASVKGVAVPGMPVNSPGMGEMDGHLITLDFNGKAFSRD